MNSLNPLLPALLDLLSPEQVISPLFLAVLDLLSLVFGVVAALCLALAMRPNPGGDMGGEPLVTFRSRRVFRWGIALLVAASLAQVPRVALALAKALY